MNPVFLSKALQQITNPNILVNVISQRVRQLGQGHRALVEADVFMSYMDIALKEVAEGKISFEIDEAVAAKGASALLGNKGGKRRK